MHARRQRRDRRQPELGGKTRRIVVRDQHIDVAGVGRCVDARAVRLDNGTRIRDGAHPREYARRGCGGRIGIVR
jgi:hypothetical protein